MSLRKEIERRLVSNQRFYAHFVTKGDMLRIADETTEDIIKIIEKRIDNWVKEADYDEEVDGCASKIKELLK